MIIKPGCRVKMHYALNLDSGEMLESTFDGEPLEFTFGVGEIIPGLERELEGMADKQKKHIEVNVKDAYGERDPDAMVRLPRKEFAQVEGLAPGLVFRLRREDGMMMFATVMELSEEEVVMDLNHPLAGKTLFFDVEILEVAVPEAEV